MDPRVAVSARGLIRSFGLRRALDGLDLAVERGRCFGLLGPNGAGKTTAIRILCGALAAHGGQLSVLGLDPEVDGHALRARIGVVPQELALYEGLGARENLSFFGRLHGVTGAELERRVARALDWAGLAERGQAHRAVAGVGGRAEGGRTKRLQLELRDDGVAIEPESGT
jgi:ABC-type multidrug transport system ATPase subunit